MKAIKELRSIGIKVELYPDNAKVGKQFQHADKRFIPYAVIVGEEEMNDNQFSLKNFISGQQQKVDLMDFEEILPQLTEKAEQYFSDVQTYIRRNFHISKTQQKAEGKKYVTEFLKNNSDILGNTLSTTTGLLGNLTLIPLYIFLMLLYRDFIKVFFYKAFKSVSSHRVNVVLKKIKNVVIDYMVGLIMVIGIIGILNTVGLYILGIDHAIFFGFLASFLVLIPYIGIAIGSLLPILFALITKGPISAVGVGSLFFAIQFLEGNFITPYIVGTKVSINSMAAIISLILFSSLWGMGGLVFAFPITAIIKLIFDFI